MSKSKSMESKSWSAEKMESLGGKSRLAENLERMVCQIAMKRYVRDLRYFIFDKTLGN
ncbi:hypothetical protein ACLSC7_000994 [Enterococcus hirae]|nr:hypothetical protein [Enterococcus hirae]EMF0049027.1 hypothetical protein [Enterococcus hirae]EMF0066399.1 hypothetical protein [Enterococcus hirae]EMF0151970.1 hypothetical protein [Enterococcus hirae]EMF0158696.1 hypothetical protein [Enterococcus hirae]EMF0177094.1 hypothetical protein [Enterococcus hirae]